jgi:uncharacterized protein YqhQ
VILVKIVLVIAVGTLFFYHGFRYNSLVARQSEKDFAFNNNDELKRRRIKFTISFLLYIFILTIIALLSRYTKIFW